MSDFRNILNYNDYQQQQYSQMDHALDDMQNISGSRSYRFGGDFTPSWDSPAAGYYNHLHAAALNDNPASPANSYAVMPHPTFTSRQVTPPPLPSSSPDLPTVSDLLKSVPYRAAHRADHNNDESDTHSSSSDVPIAAKPKGKGKGPRTPFTLRDIRKLLAVVCDVNPFMAGWGKMGKKWVEVCEKTRAVKACVGHSDATIQHKVTALLDYQKDPNTKGGAQISRELGQEGGVQVAALLEKALHQRDEAMATKEEKKEKASKKLDDDKAGGEAIRNASMTTLGCRRRGSDSTDVSDTENVDPECAAGSRRLSRKRARRQSSFMGLQSDIGDMKEMLASSAKDQQKYHEEMVEVLRSSNAAYVKSQDTFADIFRGKF